MKILCEIKNNEGEPTGITFTIDDFPCKLSEGDSLSDSIILKHIDKSYDLLTVESTLFEYDDEEDNYYQFVYLMEDVPAK